MTIFAQDQASAAAPGTADRTSSPRLAMDVGPPQPYRLYRPPFDCAEPIGHPWMGIGPSLGRCTAAWPKDSCP